MAWWADIFDIWVEIYHIKPAPLVKNYPMSLPSESALTRGNLSISMYRHTHLLSQTPHYFPRDANSYRQSSSSPFSLIDDTPWWWGYIWNCVVILRSSPTGRFINFIGQRYTLVSKKKRIDKYTQLLRISRPRSRASGVLLWFGFSRIQGLSMQPDKVEEF